MSAYNVIKFPTPQRGMSENMPSLGDMCDTLRRNWSVIDEVDKDFSRLLFKVESAGMRAKIETVAECRAIAFSIVSRYGIGG